MAFTVKDTDTTYDLIPVQRLQCSRCKEPIPINVHYMLSYEESTGLSRVYCMKCIEESTTEE